MHETNRSKLLLKGVLDTGCAPELHRIAMEAFASGREVIVDLSEVERLDGAAIQVLAALHAELSARNHTLVWEGENPAVAEHLTLAGIVAQGKCN